MVTDVDLLLVQQHAVDMLDRVVGSFGSLVMYKAVTLGVTLIVLGDLATQNVAKRRKGIVQRLVVDGKVQVLDKDIACTGLAQSRVTLRPHDAARFAFDQSVVQLFQRLLAIFRAVVVDIRISKRAAGEGTTRNR